MNQPARINSQPLFVFALPTAIAQKLHCRRHYEMVCMCECVHATAS